MAERSLTVAVVGDPHFYVERSGGGDEVSHVRLSSNGDFLDKANPWLTLKRYVTTQGLTADVLLCVGDITVYAEKAGLERAWKELLELGQLLGCSHIVSATGNHDVQSRGDDNARAIKENVIRGLSRSVGMFESLKNLEPSYPVVEVNAGALTGRRDLRTEYFGNSIAVLEADSYRLAVLNSCCEHGPQPHDHDRGSFPKSAQMHLSEALAGAEGNKINLLVCHHPPGVHGEHDLGEYDFIHNGDGLLRCLERHGAWLVIHGHKHHGRLSYAQGSNAAPVVFAASSLGICLDVAKPGVRNQFYILNLAQRESGGVRGQVRAWDWYVGRGWVSAAPDKGGIYDGCGFGHRCDISDIASQIANVAKELPCKWSDIMATIPELKYLTPDDLDVLSARLAGFKIIVEPSGDGSWDELVKANT